MTHRRGLLIGLFALAAGAAVWFYGARSREAPVATAPAPTRVAEPTEPAHPRIVDDAGILAPFGPRLGRMTDALLEDAGIDVHVVTTREPGRIESLSERLFGARDIGRQAPTGGILVLLNPASGEARIEVGYSLEGGLTDLHMSRIARDQLAPYVAYASAGMAAMDVLHYLRDQVYLAAVLGNVELGSEFRRRAAFKPFERYLSGGAGAKAALSAVPMDADFKRPIPPAGRESYAPSADLEETVAAFRRATAELAGDPTLPLFTEGSRLLRAEYPFALFEELTRLERLDDSSPLDYRVEGDYAVATSRNPAHGFVPLLLHRGRDGLWRIDLTETWKNLFFDRNGSYFLRNSNMPYGFGLAEFGAGRWYDIAAIPLGDRSLAGELERLANAKDVLSLLRRGDLWFRNAFVFAPAFAAYEAAVLAAPADPLALQTLAERAMYLGFPELAIPAYEQAGPGFEIALAEAWHDQGNGKRANEWLDRALALDPYDLHALAWKEYVAEQHGNDEAQVTAREAVVRLLADPAQPGNPVRLKFEPAQPRFHPDTTITSGDTTVHDHSRFRVTMTNPSARAVEIERVRLTSRGTARASGLGDVKDYWDYPSGARELAPGESVSFDKLWGFTVDTGHEHVRYVFETCWRGVGEAVRQCRTQWVDVLP
jgi:hypothetical protein